MNNFEEEACLLIESGGGIQINNPQELYVVLNQLLADQEERQRLGEKAWETVVKNRGAVNKTIELITRLAN
jgi:3-deoxy-D-manno-octulosonic-acid transferase